MLVKASDTAPGGIPMKLSTAALVTAIAMCCTFVLRTAGTFRPERFADPAWANSAALAALAAGVALIVFAVVFLREHIGARPGPLRAATLGVIAGAVAALLPPIQQLLVRSHGYPLERLIRSHHIAALAPLIGSLTLLIFFCVLRRETAPPASRRGSGGLRRTAAIAAVGCVVFVLLNGVAATGHYHTGQLRWVPAGHGPAALLPFVIVTAAFVALVAFFLAVARGAAKSPR
jgi:hypothetical protein